MTIWSDQHWLTRSPWHVNSTGATEVCLKMFPRIGLWCYSPHQTDPNPKSALGRNMDTPPPPRAMAGPPSPLVGDFPATLAVEISMILEPQNRGNLGLNIGYQLLGYQRLSLVSSFFPPFTRQLVDWVNPEFSDPACPKDFWSLQTFRPVDTGVALLALKHTKSWPWGKTIVICCYIMQSKDTIYIYIFILYLYIYIGLYWFILVYLSHKWILVKIRDSPASDSWPMTERFLAARRKIEIGQEHSKLQPFLNFVQLLGVAILSMFDAFFETSSKISAITRSSWVFMPFDTSISWRSCGSTCRTFLREEISHKPPEFGSDCTLGIPGHQSLLDLTGSGIRGTRRPTGFQTSKDWSGFLGLSHGHANSWWTGDEWIRIKHINTHTHTHTYVYMYIYTFT